MEQVKQTFNRSEENDTETPDQQLLGAIVRPMKQV